MDEDFIKYVKDTIINFDTVNFDISNAPSTLTKETCKALLDVVYKTVKSTKSNEDQKIKAIKILKTILIKTKNTVLINLFLTCQMWGFFCGQYRTYIQSGKKPPSVVYSERYFDILEYLLEQLNFELGIDNNNNETPFAKFWKACHTKDFQKNEFLSILALQIAGLKIDDPDTVGLVRFSFRDYENNSSCSYFIREFIKKFETKSNHLNEIKNNNKPDWALYHDFKVEFYKFIEKEYFFGYLKDEAYELLENIIGLEEARERLKAEAHSLVLNSEDARKELVVDNEDSMNSLKQLEQRLSDNVSDMRQSRKPVTALQAKEKSIVEEKISKDSPPRKIAENNSLLRKNPTTPKMVASQPIDPPVANVNKKTEQEVNHDDFKSSPPKKYKLKAFDSVVLPEDMLNNEESVKRRSRAAHSQRDANSAIDINLERPNQSMPKTQYKIFDNVPITERKAEYSIEHEVKNDSFKIKEESKLSEKSAKAPSKPPGRMLHLNEKRIEVQQRMDTKDLKRLKAFALMDKQKIFSNNIIKLGVETFFIRFNKKKEVRVKCFWDPIFGAIKNTIVNITDAQGRPIPAKIIDNSVEFALADFPRLNSFPWINLSYMSGDQTNKTKVELLLPFRKFMRIPTQSQVVSTEFSKPEYNALVTDVYPMDMDFFREAKHIHLMFRNFSLTDQNTLLGVFELQAVPDLFFVKFNVLEGARFYCELKYKSNHLDRLADEILQELVMLVGDFSLEDN